MTRLLITVLLIGTMFLLSSCERRNIDSINDDFYFNTNEMNEEEYKQFVIGIRDFVFIGKITQISDSVSHDLSDSQKSSYTDTKFTYFTFEIIHELMGELESEELTFTVTAGFSIWGDFRSRKGKLDFIPKVGDYVLVTSSMYSEYSTPTDSRFLVDQHIMSISKYEYIQLENYNSENGYLNQDDEIQEIINNMIENIEISGGQDWVE